MAKPRGAKQRAAIVIERLASEYPGSARELCALVHDNPFELLAATILSAQCTDEMVNKVTPALFARYPTPADLAEADPNEVEELIHDLYNKDYLVNPQINLTVLEYTQRTVQIVGSVNQPGAVVFPPEKKMGLVEAIARAGGQNRIADLKRVRLTRTSPEGKTENFIVNVDDLMKGVSGEQWLLLKGDVIFVPEKIF